MERMKSMSIIWAVMVFMIVGALTFIGFTYDRKLKDYHQFETELEKQCEQYVLDNEIFVDDTKKIDIKDLYKQKYIKSIKVNKNKCKGYVLVTNNQDEYEYHASIDCGRYETED